MQRFCQAYSNAMGILGLLLLVAVLAFDPRWLLQIYGVLVVFVFATLLRGFQIPLTKYSALNLLGLASVAGAFVIGAPATALGVYFAIIAADYLILR